MSLRIGILVGTKGRGSNMAAIIRACQAGFIKGSVSIVVGPSAEAPALAVAQELGVTTKVVAYDENFGEGLLAAFQDCDVICLAGFMRLVPVSVLDAFPDRVLNIHPALLPKFGGKGMYGLHVHQAVVSAGETESGCTVHAVNERYDEGPVILQLRCPVRPDDTAETLAARVLELEHRAYPEALRLLESRS
jgi:phosphoribosylglycinamide formyltransferase-1